jgi:hypothetical protein
VRRLLPLFLLTVSFLPQAKASSFWGTLENLLNIGCNYTEHLQLGEQLGMDMLLEEHLQ